VGKGKGTTKRLLREGGGGKDAAIASLRTEDLLHSWGWGGGDNWERGGKGGNSLAVQTTTFCLKRRETERAYIKIWGRKVDWQETKDGGGATVGKNAGKRGARELGKKARIVGGKKSVLENQLFARTGHSKKIDGTSSTTTKEEMPTPAVRKKRQGKRIYYGLENRGCAKIAIAGQEPVPTIGEMTLLPTLVGTVATLWGGHGRVW